MSISTLFLVLSLFFWLVYLACLHFMSTKVARTTGEIEFKRFSISRTPQILARYHEITSAGEGRPGMAYFLCYAAWILVIATAGRAC
jgi:hypothetical protein